MQEKRSTKHTSYESIILTGTSEGAVVPGSVERATGKADNERGARAAVKPGAGSEAGAVADKASCNTHASANRVSGSIRIVTLRQSTYAGVCCGG